MVHFELKRVVIYYVAGKSLYVIDNDNGCLPESVSLIQESEHLISDTYSLDDAVRILNHWCEHLPDLANGDDVQLATVLAIVGQDNVQAVLWRRLLVVGSNHPETIGCAIKELLCAPPILTSPDTYHAAGECIKKTFPLLTVEERQRIERAILSLAAESCDDEPSIRHHHWARLLGCLDHNVVTLEETRRAIATMTASAEVVPNDPPVSYGDQEEWTDISGERRHLGSSG